MKIANVAFFTAVFGTADATSLRGLLFKRHGEDSDAATDVNGRDLQGVGCYGSDTPTPEKWHPNYQAGWSNGYCTFTRDCDSPGYNTQLDCCKGAYGGQVSGTCLMRLPSPPTTSPTDTGGLDVYYPDYTTPWPEAGCLNTRPMPSGVPTYDSILACCKGAFGGQLSGACLSGLPSPPTTSPTGSGGLDIYYPDPSLPWSEGTCINDRPFPNNVGQPYDTMLDCCKGAFGGQVSGACFAALPSPPTTSPTGAGGLDIYYPEPDVAWSEGKCINDAPMPNNVGQGYDTMLDCCKGAYAGQVSGVCLAALPSPPTTSPTGSGGLDVFYPEPNMAWSEGTCINDAPMPNNVGQPYDTMLACCKGAYAGQVSGACIGALPSPPTTSPTGSGGLAVYYRDPSAPWSIGKCINDAPFPNNVGQGYASQALCCNGEFGGQSSFACFCDADPCFSCNCGSQAELDALSCGLTCS